MALCDAPQVSDSSSALNQTVEENLVQLEAAFREQTDYVSLVQKLQGQLDELIRLMVDVPFWSNTGVSLEELAHRTEAFDFYRWVVLQGCVCVYVDLNTGRLQVVGLPGPAAVRRAHLPAGFVRADPELQEHADRVGPPPPTSAPAAEAKAKSVFLSFSVCLLGVLTLIISWGSLGLELAVAAVSVAMATWPGPLPLRSDVIPRAARAAALSVGATLA